MWWTHHNNENVQKKNWVFKSIRGWHEIGNPLNVGSEEEVGVKDTSSGFLAWVTERVVMSLSWLGAAGGEGLLGSKHDYSLDLQRRCLCEGHPGGKAQ